MRKLMKVVLISTVEGNKLVERLMDVKLVKETAVKFVVEMNDGSIKMYDKAKFRNQVVMIRAPLVGKNFHDKWRQGAFIDSPKYSKESAEQKAKWDLQEKKCVRPAPTENALCVCVNAEDAVWVAERLNFAARMSQALHKEDWQKWCTEIMDLVDEAKKRRAIGDMSLLAYKLVNELVNFVGVKEEEGDGDGEIKTKKEA